MTEAVVAIAQILVAAAVASVLHELAHYGAALFAGRNPRVQPREWAVAWETVGATGVVIRRADWAIALAPFVAGVPVGVGLWLWFGVPLWTLVAWVGMAALMAAVGRRNVPAWVREYGFGPLTILAAVVLAAATALPYWLTFAYTLFALYGLVTNDVQFEMGDDSETWALGPEELDRIEGRSH